MTFRSTAWWPVPLALGFLAGAPPQDPEGFVRQGDVAFQAGNYETALKLYEQAETDTTDPGLVAFDEGAALYRLGKFTEAERHYLRCREDAAGVRRARVLYDLGNALVQQAGDKDPNLLVRAIAYYEECLRQREADSALVRNAQHNLAMANELFVKARQAKKPPEPDQGDRDHNTPGSDDKNKSNSQPSQNNPDQAKPDPTQQVRPDPDRSPDPHQGTVQTGQPPPPGVGNLPPIPDEDTLIPMSPEDTEAYLRRATARILQEHREHELRSARPPSRNMKDW